MKVASIFLAGLAFSANPACAEVPSDQPLTSFNCYFRDMNAKTPAAKSASMRFSFLVSQVSPATKIPSVFTLDDPNGLVGNKPLNEQFLDGHLVRGKSFLIMTFGKVKQNMFYLATDQIDTSDDEGFKKFLTLLLFEATPASGDINAADNKFVGDCYVFRHDNAVSANAAFEKMKSLPGIETAEGSVQ